MVSEQAKLVEVLGRLEPPGHLCAIFESQQERFSVVVPFIRIGPAASGGQALAGPRPAFIGTH